MHCPRCGTSAGEGQQFCRTCGLNLEKVAELVAESSPAETRGVESLRLKELQRKHESWGGIAGLITFALILVLFVTIVFSQIIMKGGLLILPGSLLILLAAGGGSDGLLPGIGKIPEAKTGGTATAAIDG